MIPRLGLLCQSFWPSFQAFGEQFLHLTHIFFGKKQLFSTLTKRKRTLFRLWAVLPEAAALHLAKEAFSGLVPAGCLYSTMAFLSVFTKPPFPASASGWIKVL